MLTRITSSKLFTRLKEKKYRDLFIAGEVRRTVPFQLRALRTERDWTQAELGKEAEMPQTVISRIENGDAASLSIRTLLKLASALDVALVVRFEPIDRLIHWVDNLGPEVISPQKSSVVLAEMEQTATETRAVATSAFRLIPSTVTATGAVQRTLGFASLALMNQGRATSTGNISVPAAATGANQAIA